MRKVIVGMYWAFSLTLGYCIGCNIAIASDPPRANVERLFPTANASAVVRLTPSVANTRTVSYRNPIGHTHTCPRCGDTWDHNKNPTHTCQRCGASQFTIDTPSRMVQVYGVSTGGVPLQYTLPRSTSGCGPGGCPSQPTGLFRIR